MRKPLIVFTDVCLLCGSPYIFKTTTLEGLSLYNDPEKFIEWIITDNLFRKFANYCWRKI